jgi:hypothetical protein
MEVSILTRTQAYSDKPTNVKKARKNDSEKTNINITTSYGGGCGMGMEIWLRLKKRKKKKINSLTPLGRHDRLSQKDPISSWMPQAGAKIYSHQAAFEPSEANVVLYEQDEVRNSVEHFAK